METTKICTKCKVEKEFREFHKHKTAKYGLNLQCKSCKKESYEKNKENTLLKSKEYYKNNKDKIIEYSKKQYENNKDKILVNRKQNIDKEKKASYSKKYYKDNKEKLNIKSKNYYDDNRERMLTLSKEWYNNNKEEVAFKNAERLKEDTLFKLKGNIRNLIRSTFNRPNSDFRKRTKTEDILGCTVPEFIKHIQDLFSEGMTLENNGQCVECWHIDHKIPISSAKTEEDIIRLNHYTNLQPLWSRDNLSKGKKYE